MKDKRTFLFMLEIFIISVMLALLAAVAIPHVGKMLEASKNAPRYTGSQSFQAVSIPMPRGDDGVFPRVKCG